MAIREIHSNLSYCQQGNQLNDIRGSRQVKEAEREHLSCSDSFSPDLALAPSAPRWLGCGQSYPAWLEHRGCGLGHCVSFPAPAGDKLQVPLRSVSLWRVPYILGVFSLRLHRRTNVQHYLRCIDRHQSLFKYVRHTQPPIKD